MLLSDGGKEATLKRAVIRVKPEYFSWSIEAQERYRVEMPDADMFRIHQALLKALFSISVKTKEEMNKAFDTFDDQQYLLFNSTLLPLNGIGDDHFSLNEYLGDKTILDFDTLFDYDYDDHCFQEQARKKDVPRYKAHPYRGTPYQRWARLYIDGAFYYAILSCMAGYLLGILDESGSDKISELIPHEYVDGPDHGKREGGGFLYDKRINGGGLEAQLEELRDRFHRYTTERHNALGEEFDKEGKRRVYLIDRSNAHDPQMDFVFSDKTALQAVRFRHFMEDCRKIMGDAIELETLIEQERQRLLEYLENAHQDILHNFDPKVLKFRKKRKIILADRALKDLL
ncbi:MAG: hypothetical protein JXL84_00155 [Deltaproteobacteria bacterium]|nr:hypothetical protein [Deltaproteobacteria bacterium]